MCLFVLALFDMVASAVAGAIAAADHIPHSLWFDVLYAVLIFRCIQNSLLNIKYTSNICSIFEMGVASSTAAIEIGYALRALINHVSSVYFVSGLTMNGADCFFFLIFEQFTFATQRNRVDDGQRWSLARWIWPKHATRIDANQIMFR